MADTGQQGNNYINNAEFYEQITIWIKEVNDAENEGLERPPLTEYLGECFLKIATNLSYKPNFVGYTFRDDLISDGYENCILYANRFKPEKSKNPFSYFTQIIFYAFLRRIAKEKKGFNLKNKIIMESGVLEQFISVDDKDNQLHIANYVKYLKNFVKEDPAAEKREPDEPKTIDDF